MNTSPILVGEVFIFALRGADLSSSGVHFQTGFGVYRIDNKMAMPVIIVDVVSIITSKP
jgi:hypothetical protein